MSAKFAFDALGAIIVNFQRDLALLEGKRDQVLDDIQRHKDAIEGLEKSLQPIYQQISEKNEVINSLMEGQHALDRRA